MSTVGNTSVPPNNKISLTGPSLVEIFMYRMMIKHALSERGKQSVSHFPRNALITAVRLAIFIEILTRIESLSTCTES